MLHRGSNVQKNLALTVGYYPYSDILETTQEPYYINPYRERLIRVELSFKQVFFLFTDPRTVEGFHCLYHETFISP